MVVSHHVWIGWHARLFILDLWSSIRWAGPALRWLLLLNYGWIMTGYRLDYRHFNRAIAAACRIPMDSTWGFGMLGYGDLRTLVVRGFVVGRLDGSDAISLGRFGAL